MNRKWTIALVCLLVLTLFLGAGGAQGEDGSKGYNFVVIQGGVHPYYGPFPLAINDASKDLGIPEPPIYAPQLFDQNEQNTIIDSILARGVDGIAMQAADPVGGNEKIAEIVEMGIPVVGFAGPPSEPTMMTFCLATDVYLAAYEGAKTLIEEMGGKGNVVHLTGMLAEPNTSRRMEGVQKAVDEYPDVELIQTIADLDVAEAAQNAINNLMAARRQEIDGIVITAYIPSVALAATFTQLEETRIKSVACDADEAVLKAIEDGFLTGTMNQNPYGQAYLCITALKMFADGYTYKADSPFFVNSGFYYINQGNIAQTDDLARKATEDLKAGFEDFFNAP